MANAGTASLAKDFTGTYQPGLLTLIFPSLLGVVTVLAMRRKQNKNEA
jgi:hypothetical protein